MGRDVDLFPILFGAAKLIIALFVLKVVLMVAGYPGYIPVADEIYSFIMKGLFAIGGNPNVLPHNLN